jgi:uncharacterized membrane protein YtjA (UPF0391 family)
MLTWIIIFLVIALLAGALGLPSISLLSRDIAKLLFIIFIVLFIGSLILHFMH